MNAPGQRIQDKIPDSQQGPDRSKIWEHSIEWALFSSLLALTSAAILPGRHVPHWAAPAIAAVCGTIAALVIKSQTRHRWFSLYAFALGLYLAGWTAWAEEHLWKPITLTAWIIGVIAFSAGGAQAALAAAVPPPPPPPGPEEERRKEMKRWEYMFETVGCPGVKVTSLASQRTGRVLRLQLPRATGAVTLESLQQAAGRMCVILRLPKNRIEFEELDHAGDIQMRLRERDVLGEIKTLPPEHYASTINEPFAVGVQEDGSIATIHLRNLHAMIIGMTDAGKSNLINVILTQIAHCRDAIVWVIDMKGGRVARPWLQPWIEGRTQEPVIDWVATTREEAQRMIRCFIAAIQARAESGIGGSKITPSVALPQIILITDEMADLFGINRGTKSEVGDSATNNQFIRWGEEITQKGRSEACVTMWASQRGVAAMAGSANMKANCKLRIMLGVADENEGRYANAANTTAQKRAASMIDTPGAGVITTGKKGSLLVKFYLHDHPEKPGTKTGESLCDDGCVPSCPIYKTALETGSVRPRIDRMTATAMGEDYALRWTKDRIGNLARRLIPAGTGGHGPAGDMDINDFDQIISDVQSPVTNLPASWKKMLDVLASHGVAGASPLKLGTKLADAGVTWDRATLQRNLRQCANLGLCHDAEFGRWVIGPRKPKRVP
jgi:hypothetical protein